ncbi:MAG: mannitol-1-phosphate 5-dehydrogenase, partial [Spirochaetaceae bacterium]|nr:mannitol-1-phosphate 5-dehydrogenase [Spirochaetaceae bacterium]
MSDNNTPRVVIFGAGNIGRSFIAPVFTRGGYEAVFADVAPAVLAALEERNHYTLVEKTDDGDTRHEVKPVRAVDARDSAAVARELDGAEICVTCVGAGALPIVLKSIAAAVSERARSLD